MKWPRSRLALVTALAAGFAAAAIGAANAQTRTGQKTRSGVAYAGQGASSSYVDLSQDSSSGAGFYPLPKQYRTGAAQERQNRPVQYAGERNPIAYAAQSEAIGYDYDPGAPFGGGYAFSNTHSVFDPDDGVGTPFFAGYYN